jgi:hypothetical protein
MSAKTISRYCPFKKQKTISCRKTIPFNPRTCRRVAGRSRRPPRQCRASGRAWASRRASGRGRGRGWRATGGPDTGTPLAPRSGTAARSSGSSAPSPYLQLRVTYSQCCGSGSESTSQRYGSAVPDPDPDPHQNFMDPQHCLQPWTK